MSSSQYRTRTAGLLSPVSWAYVSNTGVWSSGQIAQRSGQYDVMSDIVTRPFVAGKSIVNSPMNSVKTTRAYTPVSGSQTHSKATTGITSYSGTSSWWGTHDALFDSLLAQTGVTSDPLIIQASTKALAGVRKPEMSGLVTIAEARETIKGLLNPINGVLKFLDGAMPSKRKRKRTKRAKGMVSAVADQHLSIVFGLLPFISDMQSILKALQAIEPLPIRMTSRGEASAFGEKSSNTDTIVFEDPTTIERKLISAKVDVAISVRAYVLYEASVSLQNALGLSISDVPKAVWQTATLSFVIDWFANVGDFISAITPVEGITYLASGITTTVVQACHASGSYSLTAKPQGGWNGNWTGGSDVRVTVAKSRQPGNLANHLGITLKRNMHSDVLNTFQITAGLSLITQRLVKIKTSLPR